MTTRRLPVSMLTGFLGSGKTTLLSPLLRRSGMRIAVIINELGAVDIDGALVERKEADAIVLDNGCICCTVRDDLVTTLISLHERQASGDIPAFERVVIETTGLADPAPILHTFIAAPQIGRRYRLDGVVTTVDAVHGSGQLDENPESVKQAAVADRLVITKADLADAAAMAALEERLERINPSAQRVTAIKGDIDPRLLLDVGLWNARTKSIDVQRWLSEERVPSGAHGHHKHDHRCEPDCAHDHSHRHDDGIRTFCLRFERPLAWSRISEALDLLAQRYGPQLLRTKGLLNIEGVAVPAVIHGVQHSFYPPGALDSWPSSDRRSRIVFITRGLDEDSVRRVLVPLVRQEPLAAA